MAAMSASAEQSPPPECLPMPRFQSGAGRARERGSDETLVASSSTTASPPAEGSSSAWPPGLLAALHYGGRCLPCKFLNQAGGCKCGVNCKYCHYPHHGWSSARTHKYFRKHVDEYHARYGPRARELR
eukprot:TRINITY_DN8281_c0_g2_i1.p2 TRINITY_DN8281_c0_g2~~TRINITY_DN8281_c0_g2_i1.p2  ORF type:complete len:128 (+),score=8.80 TRINITY_DN8281_c0_g2_i1:89-472(+)